MSVPIRLNPEAERDFEDARLWYESRKPGLGSEFVRRVDEALLRIRDFPLSFSVVRKPFRALVTSQFPYSVVYRIDPTQITVVAIYHTRRNPRGWQSRTS